MAFLNLDQTPVLGADQPLQFLGGMLILPRDTSGNFLVFKAKRPGSDHFHYQETVIWSAN